MRKRVWLFPLFTLLIALMAGCKSESAGAIHGVPLGRNEVIRTAVSLSPSTTEILRILAPAVRLVGKTESDNARGMEEVPVVMKGIKPDYEKIASIKPDVVVYDSTLFSEADMAKFKELDIEVFDFHGDTVDAYYDRLRRFAARTNGELDVSRYVDRVEAAMDAARNDIPDQGIKIAYVMPGENGNHLVAGTESFISEISKELKLVPVGPSGKLYMPMNAEQFLASDPEIIVLAAPHADGDAMRQNIVDTVKKFKADTRFKATKAFQKQNIYALDMDEMIQQGAQIDELVGKLSAVVVDRQ